MLLSVTMVTVVIINCSFGRYCALRIKVTCAKTFSSPSNTSKKLISGIIAAESPSHLALIILAITRPSHTFTREAQARGAQEGRREEDRWLNTKEFPSRENRYAVNDNSFCSPCCLPTQVHEWCGLTHTRSALHIFPLHQHPLCFLAFFHQFVFFLILLLSLAADLR